MEHSKFDVPHRLIIVECLMCLIDQTLAWFKNASVYYCHPHHQVPLLESGDVPALRELHPPPHRAQHHPAHAQRERERGGDIHHSDSLKKKVTSFFNVNISVPRNLSRDPGHPLQLQPPVHPPLHHRVHLQARLVRAQGQSHFT